MFKVFISHSRHDVEYCNAFDSACARVGLRSFRSEFENIEKPPWMTIKSEINKSNALFLLLGKKLRERQRNVLVDTPGYTDWLFTQNWISFEIGVAAQKGIDIWVLSDSADINFPVLYLNNYYLWEGDLTNPNERELLRILKTYSEYRRVNFDKKAAFTCQNPLCRATYNIHQQFARGAQIKCPSCLKRNEFPEGWLLESKDSTNNLSQTNGLLLF